MAIICDDDMEVILKGKSEETVRKMLDNRLFALIKMPKKKPEKHSSPFSSSVFVGFISSILARSFAVRFVGTDTVYEDCEYYLKVYHRKGTDQERKGYFDRALARNKKTAISVTYPTLNELVEFLKDKELVLITNYMQYGNFEMFKLKDFLEDILFVRKDSESEFIRRDEFCDVRIYLTRLDGSTNQDNSFHTEDIRNYDIRKRIIDLIEKISKKYFSDEEEYSKLYYSAEFETQERDIQAAYFVTRFHSNLNWDANPVNIVTSRISAFNMPGIVSTEKVVNLPADKKTKNHINGEEYMIDSIHFNSDIFNDLTEFEKYLDSYFCYFMFD